MLDLIKRAFSRSAASDAFENRRAGKGAPYSGAATSLGDEESSVAKGPWTNTNGASTPPPSDILVEPTTEIIVPKSAFEAWPENPHPLVDAVVDYVNALSNQGLFKRSEIHAVARQAYNCDYYLAQVLNGGHAQFVGNAGVLIEETWDDVVAAFFALREENYLILAQAAQKWVQENPDLAKQQTGFEGGIDPVLAKLDKPFFLLNTKSPLRPKIAEWLAMHPDLKVVDDDDLGRDMQNLIDANPMLGHRKAILTCAGVSGQLADPLRVGTSMCCGRVSPPDFLVQIGNGTYRDVEGDMAMAFLVSTMSGTCYATPKEGQGVTLYDCVQHDNAHLPENKFDATLEDIQAFRPNEMGLRLSHVSQDDILSAIDVMQRMQVGEAIHLLATKLGLSNVSSLTILNAGALQNGQVAVICGQIVEGQVWLYRVTEQGASCDLAGAMGRQLASVTRAEISFHAQSHAIASLR